MITYTVQEVAEQLKVCDKTIKGIIKSGKLSAAKIGRVWRISEPDLNTYFKTQSITARKKAS